MGASPLISAPGVGVYINGKPYGLGFNFEIASDTPRKRIRAIDILTGLELAPTDAAVQFTLSIYRLRGGGGIEGAGMTVPFPDLARENYFSITLVDLATKFIIFQADQCSVESQNWGVRIKSYLLGDIRISALSWSNEVVSINN